MKQKNKKLWQSSKLIIFPFTLWTLEYSYLLVLLWYKISAITLTGVIVIK